jgi:hypothetical protein
MFLLFSKTGILKIAIYENSKYETGTLVLFTGPVSTFS